MSKADLMELLREATSGQAVEQAAKPRAKQTAKPRATQAAKRRAKQAAKPRATQTAKQPAEQPQRNPHCEDKRFYFTIKNGDLEDQAKRLLAEYSHIFSGYEFTKKGDKIKMLLRKDVDLSKLKSFLDDGNTSLIPPEKIKEINAILSRAKSGDKQATEQVAEQTAEQTAEQAEEQAELPEEIDAVLTVYNSTTPESLTWVLSGAFGDGTVKNPSFIWSPKDSHK